MSIARSQGRRRARQAVPMGLRFLEENEQRILKQKHLIDKLKAAKLDTTRAEAALRAFEQTQIKLLNHWQLMQTLLNETPGE